jgi:lysophospholipase L1-like esterase
MKRVKALFITGGILLGALLPGCSKAENLQLTLPPAWHGVVGVPMHLHFDNIVQTENLGQYQFKVECVVGKTEAQSWHVLANQEGSFPLKVTLQKPGGEILGTGQTMLHISPANAGAERKIRLLIVGDSLTHASLYPNELARLLKESGNPSVTFLGTHRPAAVRGGVAHEGYGGWKWVDFFTKYEPQKTGEVAGPLARKATSPFIFPAANGKGEFDLARYVRDHCDGVPPDVVMFLLGINDCFGADPEKLQAMDAKISEVLGHAEKLLGEFRQAFPKATLAVGLTTPPNSRQEAFQANYGRRYQRWGWKRIQHRLVQRMISQLSGREKEGIYLVATELNLDPEVGYPVDNAVHPNANGYAQIATSFYGWLKYWSSSNAAK